MFSILLIYRHPIFIVQRYYTLRIIGPHTIRTLTTVLLSNLCPSRRVVRKSLHFISLYEILTLSGRVHIGIMIKL